MEKIAKLFPAYLMNPANRETFDSRNFCRLQAYYAYYAQGHREGGSGGQESHWKISALS